LAVGLAGQLFSTLVRLYGLTEHGDRGCAIATAEELGGPLHDTAARLYPEGPTHCGLWERAGGYDADAPLGPTGRLRWQLALTAVIQGWRGAPGLEPLLEAMLTDYPKNEDLRLIATRLRERTRL
jgi:hypothetical protein